jgi:hypothetical protein
MEAEANYYLPTKKALPKVRAVVYYPDLTASKRL